MEFGLGMYEVQMLNEEECSLSRVVVRLFHIFRCGPIFLTKSYY